MSFHSLDRLVNRACYRMTATMSFKKKKKKKAVGAQTRGRVRVPLCGKVKTEGRRETSSLPAGRNTDPKHQPLSHFPTGQRCACRVFVAFSEFFFSFFLFLSFSFFDWINHFRFNLLQSERFSNVLSHTSIWCKKISSFRINRVTTSRSILLNQLIFI